MATMTQKNYKLRPDEIDNLRLLAKVSGLQSESETVRRLIPSAEMVRAMKALADGHGCGIIGTETDAIGMVHIIVADALHRIMTTGDKPLHSSVMFALPAEPEATFRLFWQYWRARGGDGYTLEEITAGGETGYIIVRQPTPGVEDTPTD